MRAPIWFPLGLGGAFLVMGALNLLSSSLNSGFDLFGIVWCVVGASTALACLNFAVLKVEPHRIVSRRNNGAVKVPLGPDDRLFAADRRLWVLRRGSHWEEIALNTPMLRGSDWAAFEQAVHRRWPPSR
ncbi:hypothetical protein GCM10009853_029960 [Glycomyces scopariae]